MTETIKVKAGELAGFALRYAVAKACGYEVVRDEECDRENFLFVVTNKALVTETDNGLVGYLRGSRLGSMYDYKPERSWSICGRLTTWCGKHYGMVIDIGEGSVSIKRDGGRTVFKSNDLGVAICRAVVCARLGDEVEVPAELVKGGA